MPDEKKPPFMSPEAFARWLEAMQKAGLARYDADCARLLGITPRHALKVKREGGTKQMALACAALLARVEPYA